MADIMVALVLNFSSNSCLFVFLNVCWQVKHSSASLFSYLKAHHGDNVELERLCKTIIEIFQHYHFVDRVTEPLLEFLDRLFSSGCVRSVLENPQSTFASDVLRHVKLEIGRTRDIFKLMGSVNILCHLVQVSGPKQFTLVLLKCILSCSLVSRILQFRLICEFTLTLDWIL